MDGCTSAQKMLSRERANLSKSDRDSGGAFFLAREKNRQKHLSRIGLFPKCRWILAHFHALIRKQKWQSTWSISSKHSRSWNALRNPCFSTGTWTDEPGPKLSRIGIANTLIFRRSWPSSANIKKHSSVAMTHLHHVNSANSARGRITHGRLS